MNLTDIQALVLETLGDPAGAKYTAAQVAQAVRMTLPYFDMYNPEIRTEDVLVENSARELELDSLNTPRRIVSLVLYSGSDHLTEYQPPFYTFVKESVPWVAFTGINYANAGDTLRVTYMTNHTIDGLDDQELTTIPLTHINQFIQGVVAHCKLIRANALSETYGTRTSDMSSLYEEYLKEFVQFIANISVLSTFTNTGFPKGWEF